MADKKISALTSLAQADIATATDVLPIVDTSATETKKATPAAIVGAAAAAGLTNVDINSGAIDGTTVGASSASSGAFTTLSASGSVTLSGGTANGVLYLNGSKVATSGSAFVFDGTNVGIGTSSPTQKLDVNGTSRLRGLLTLDSGVETFINAYYSAAYKYLANGYALRTYMAGDGSYVFANAPSGLADGSISWSERFRVTNAGNLGIGTSSPATTLHVNSGTYNVPIVAESTDPNVYIVLKDNTTTGAVGDAPLAIGGIGDNLLFRTSSLERLRIDSSGNVGIGTTSPTKMLELSANNGAGVLNVLRFTDTDTAVTGAQPTGRIEFAENDGGDTTVSAFFEVETVSTAGGGEMKFGTGTAGVSATERLRITSAGDVGIGTSSPLAKLSISGTSTGSNFLAATFANEGLTAGSTVRINFLSGEDGTAGRTRAIIEAVSPSANNGDLLFLTRNAGTVAERLRITSAGNVGIGTTNPQGRLDLGDGTSAKAITWGGSTGTAKYSTIWTEYSSGSLILGAGVEGNTSAANFLYSYTGTIGTSAIELDSFGSDGIKFYTDSSAARTAGTVATMSERMRISQSGNVGIGTTSPSSKLHLSGAATADARLTFTQTTAGLSSQIQQGSTGMAISALGSQAMLFETNGTERLRLDSAGNLGLGVTPSAWAGNSKTITVSNAVVGRRNNGASIFAHNLYESAADTFTYTQTGVAARMEVPTSGGFTWNVASSGTAGSTISFTQALTLDANRNLLLNGTTAPASGVGTFAIFNGTAPTGSVTNGCVLYAEDVSSSSELKVRDEAGNVTTLSPHNFSLIPEGASEDMAWAYYSEKGGKRINVDMLKLARMVEKLTGEKLVYEA